MNQFNMKGNKGFHMLDLLATIIAFSIIGLIVFLLIVGFKGYYDNFVKFNETPTQETIQYEGD